MSNGIAISITRIVDEVREARPDDPCYHRIWTGTRWTSLASPLCRPDLAERWNIKQAVHTTRLEFPSAGTISFDAEAYKRGSLFKEMVQNGILRR